MTAISFISSAGSSGGAVAPFTTGLLAQAVGTFVLHPICIGLFIVMMLCWFGLPKLEKRSE
jgi:fucose permease